MCLGDSVPAGLPGFCQPSFCGAPPRGYLVGTADSRIGYNSWIGVVVCVGGGVEVGLSLCGLGCAACPVLTCLLQCPPGVASGAPHKRLADGEQGYGHAPALVVAVLSDGGPVGVVQRKGAKAKALEVQGGLT